VGPTCHLPPLSCSSASLLHSTLFSPPLHSRHHPAAAELHLRPSPRQPLEPAPSSSTGSGGGTTAGEGPGDRVAVERGPRPPRWRSRGGAAASPVGLAKAPPLLPTARGGGARRRRGAPSSPRAPEFHPHTHGNGDGAGVPLPRRPSPICGVRDGVPPPRATPTRAPAAESSWGRAASGSSRPAGGSPQDW
jgi:hypothetical protein